MSAPRLVPGDGAEGRRVSLTPPNITSKAQARCDWGASGCHTGPTFAWQAGKETPDMVFVAPCRDPTSQTLPGWRRAPTTVSLHFPATRSFSLQNESDPEEKANTATFFLNIQDLITWAKVST